MDEHRCCKYYPEVKETTLTDVVRFLKEQIENVDEINMMMPLVDICLRLESATEVIRSVEALVMELRELHRDLNDSFRNRFTGME